MIVVTDTSPLRYLVMLGNEWLLPRLYQRVICPDAVLRECASPGAPELVRTWAANPPEWLEIRWDFLDEPGADTVAGLLAGGPEAVALAAPTIR